MAELLKTPIHPLYEKYGAKTIDFGGWDLPVQFSGIKAEHEAVRTKAGLFDVSHMGEIIVEGAESTAYLQYLLSNDIEKIKIGKAQYNIMCYENGGTVDDLVVYRLSETKYVLVVNAANTEKDFDWIVKNVRGDVTVSDVSSKYGQLALQGPDAEKILAKLTNIDLNAISFFGFVEDAEIAGVKTIISRSGYTGEDGFEIYMPSDDATKVFEAIMAEKVLPIGLGARDTLRLEAVLALYGQELSKDITPLEAGLNFAVKLKKEADFIGKEALIKQKEAGLTRKLVGIELIERGIPRHDYPVFLDGKQIGVVTSGTQSPTLGTNIGLALIDIAHTELGQEIEIGIRNKKVKAKVVATPFYKRAK
ncbi:glycine cleavage system aminomethyltransferase GcvT [Listeria ivanovii]|uniref:glycine cleavage system aminomethyltransferase GcvT n=1 Tax=Listeria ivanovii TaxID=1638 RepID=UPI000512962D|nr:glycine cleavage system aminomethyltransferase GcvT [Listeria ivanovii]AIS62577.1 glycine cleavage system protein T [Listeria ivanovii subsp. londoniensis]MBK1964957.1 glycine cleavage system aminomethyltransferase GcvT [Listeria ivanovii subsp. londoniensis]MBK1984478.1 glycine cleavage system aminomethyltransferase GcvT [Listeria ivanovii subsp. londoniensis]MBK1995760.1 glycine cleavage system aminomethyltransferase GcvT [Listeria ivanovii subsp. londoniensis]